MTLMQLVLDGAVTAAELLALLFVAPVAAHEPVDVGAVALEQRIRLHRLASTIDVRLLGSLADVRVAHAVVNPSSSTADLAPALPAADEHVDALRVVRSDVAVDLLADCSEAAAGGHARLTEDERIADALQLGPGASAIIEAVGARPLVRTGRFHRVMLPARLDPAAPRAVFLDEAAGPFLLVVPHRAAERSTLVLRPASGEAETLDLGAVDTRHGVLVPLPGRLQHDDLARGAIELELGAGAASWWSTVPLERRRTRVEAAAPQSD